MYEKYLRLKIIWLEVSVLCLCDTSGCSQLITRDNFKLQMIIKRNFCRGDLGRWDIGIQYFCDSRLWRQGAVSTDLISHLHHVIIWSSHEIFSLKFRTLKAWRLIVLIFIGQICYKVKIFCWSVMECNWCWYFSKSTSF